MCRMPRLLATVAAPALLLLLSGAACAETRAAGPPLGASSAQPSLQPAAQPAEVAALQPAAKPATPEQRAEANRLPLLARAAFWAREVDVDPRDAVAGANLAASLRGLGRIEEARATADQVLVVHPNDVEALLEAVRARLAQNQGFYAIDLAKRAQTLAPADWRPVSLLAIAYEQSERDPEALAAHNAAVAMAPNAAAPLANLAMYEAGHNDLTGAESLLRKAVRLPDANVQVRLNLALVLGLEGRLAEAETLTRQDLPPDQAANNIAWLKDAVAAPPAATGRSYESVTRAGS